MRCPKVPGTFGHRRYGAPVFERSERQVIAFLAFVGILMAFGIDAALPAFDELRADFDLDARGISAAVTGTAYFGGMALGQLACGVLADRFGQVKSMAALLAFKLVDRHRSPSLIIPCSTLSRLVNC